MTKKCGAQESEWTVILAHHLLSKLAVSTFYKMDSGYKTQHLTCPCQCGEHPSGIYSDVSFKHNQTLQQQYMKNTLQPLN